MITPTSVVPPINNECNILFLLVFVCGFYICHFFSHPGECDDNGGLSITDRYGGVINELAIFQCIMVQSRVCKARLINFMTLLVILFILFTVIG